jgi:hypothetical protein
MSESPAARTARLSSCEFLVLRTPAPIPQPSAASKAIGVPDTGGDCSLLFPYQPRLSRQSHDNRLS